MGVGPWFCPRLALCSLVFAAAGAQADLNYALDISSAWRHVEERQDGATLVKEDGPAAGVRGALAYHVGAWSIGFDGAFARAALDYDGSTQSGAALETRTDWTDGHIAAAAWREFAWVTVGGRLEYQRRTRDIASTADAAGLTEHYTTGWVGLSLRLKPAPRAALELELGCAFHSEVEVVFAPPRGSGGAALDDAVLEVDEHCRAEFATAFDVRGIGRSRLVVRPFIGWQRYPRSTSARLTSAGADVGRVYLPATEFFALGLSLRIGRRRS